MILNADFRHFELQIKKIFQAAADYGGPRREFFSLILPELKKGFFDPIREWSKDYETIGKIMGESLTLKVLRCFLRIDMCVSSS